MKVDKGSGTVQHSPYKRQNGVQLAANIVRREGIRGLYRGFGASIATFVPSSAVWQAYRPFPGSSYASINQSFGRPPDRSRCKGFFQQEISGTETLHSGCNPD